MEPELIRRCIDVLRRYEKESIEPIGCDEREALDVVLTQCELDLNEREIVSGWRSDQIGGLMMAATEAIDTVEEMLFQEGRAPVDAAKIASWRAAVAREEQDPAPSGAGRGTP